MFMVSFLSEILRRTPIYAWVIFALLLKRGLGASRDNALSFSKMLIFPVIFIVWGLWKVVTGFAFPMVSIMTYVVFAGVGTSVGYGIYSRFRSFYQRDGVIYRTGTYMPLVVMMLNFLVKYGLNVAMSINPGAYDSMGFNLFYSAACGFSVGLSIGGLLQAYQATKEA